MIEDKEETFPAFNGNDWEWRLKASCIGKSHLFDLVDGKDDEDREEIRKKNLANFELAGKVCASCPVTQECEDTATSEDLAFTYRAGMIPLSVSMVSRGRPRRDVCKRGHEGEYVVHKSGKKHCKGCKRELAREKARARGTRPIRATTCPKGHDDWWVNSTGRRKCRQCQREARLKAIANFDPAKYAGRVCNRGHVGMYGVSGGQICCTECSRENNRNTYLRQTRGKLPG